MRPLLRSPVLVGGLGVGLLALGGAALYRSPVGIVLLLGGAACVRSALFLWRG